MKLLRLIIIFILLPIILHAQSFIFHSDTLNFYGQPGDFFDYYVDIHNVSGNNLQVSIIRTRNDLPDEIWSSSVCTGQLCFPPEIDTVDYAALVGTLPPGGTIDFHLQVYTNPTVPGTGVITIKVENQANPSDTAALTFTFSTGPTHIKQNRLPITGMFQLHANYPNPFNPETTIPFEIGGFQSVPVKLSIYNVIGQLVVIPLDKVLSPGLYEIPWDGRDRYGKPASSGLYFYELSAGNYRVLGKMILMK